MTGPATGDVVVVGVSARGLAESAARAGYSVAAVDGFGDLDLRRLAVRVLVRRSADGRFPALAAARAA
ncbi:MAG TPA: hypothetical protein VNK43_01670, partial [Gemmatimonadales bacterium]|nr:hypothetical protein [Gemmatimonadales bacterium]